MYKYIIVDDEPLIREGVQLLLDWEKLGFELVGTARNGEGGLNLIENHQVDLALIDIRMPKMNGIELIERIRTLNKDCHIIIISAHSEFSYAQQAIKYNVDAYVLVPIDEKVLEKEVIQIKKELDNERIKKQKDLDNSKHRLSEFYKQSILNIAIEDDELSAKLTENFNGLGSEANVLLIKDTLTNPGEDRDEFFNIFAENSPSESGFGLKNDDIYIHIIFDKPDWKILEELGEYRSRLSDKVIELPIALGHKIYRWEDLRYSYEVAKYLLSRSFLFKNSYIPSFKDIIAGNTSQRSIDLDDVREYVFFGDKEDIFNLVQIIKNQVLSSLPEETEIKYYLLELYIELAKNINFAVDLTQSKNDYLQTNKFEDLLNIFTSDLLKLRNQVQHSEEVSGQSNNSAVSRAIFIIKTNYNSDINLDEVAEKLNYNANYFGRLFKQETGKSFSKYLDDVRLEKSLVYLKQSNNKIYEIARKVGFYNPDSYSSKFKKKYGVSPKDYKF